MSGNGALFARSAEFALMRSLAMGFRGILRSRNPSKLDTWIDDTVNSGLVAIERFARVLRRDIDAVCNAIELPWQQRPGGGPDQPPEDDQACDVWQGRPGAPQSTHA